MQYTDFPSWCRKVGAREALEEMVEMDQEEQTDDVFVEDPAAPLLLGDREESVSGGMDGGGGIGAWREI